MFGKFKNDKHYIFSKEKYIEDRGQFEYMDNKSWVDLYNNKEVEKMKLHNSIGYIDKKMIIKDWCKEIN